MKVGQWTPLGGMNITDSEAFYENHAPNITLIVMTREVSYKSLTFYNLSCECLNNINVMWKYKCWNLDLEPSRIYKVLYKIEISYGIRNYTLFS